MHEPMNRTFALTLTWAGAGTALLGVGFAVAAAIAPTLLESIYAALGPGTVTDMGPAARLGAGIYGGLMAGWGTTMWALGRGRRAEVAVGWGLLAWWGVDNAASIACGYPLNAVSNTVLLLLFAPAWLALARARREAT